MALFSTGYHFYCNLCTPQCSIGKEKTSISISHYPITLLHHPSLDVPFASQVTIWLN